MCPLDDIQTRYDIFPNLQVFLAPENQRKRNEVSDKDQHPAIRLISSIGKMADTTRTKQVLNQLLAEKKLAKYALGGASAVGTIYRQQAYNPAVLEDILKSHGLEGKWQRLSGLFEQAP